MIPVKMSWERIPFTRPISRGPIDPPNREPIRAANRSKFHIDVQGHSDVAMLGYFTSGRVFDYHNERVNYEEPATNADHSIADARHVDRPKGYRQSTTARLGDAAHFKRSARFS